jgi:hypothetical protein
MPFRENCLPQSSRIICVIVKKATALKNIATAFGRVRVVAKTATALDVTIMIKITLMSLNLIRLLSFNDFSA